MSRTSHIKALIDNAEETIKKVEILYEKSLSSKSLDPKLLIQIKNILENLRSALDYVAKDIFDQYCAENTQDKVVAVYFPILRQSANKPEFDNFMKGRFPGLQSSFPELFSFLEELQYFKSSNNEWLIHLNVLCQENKHEQLTPQTREESKHTSFSNSLGNSVSWNEGVSFGPGGKLTLGTGGKLTLRAGAKISFGKSGVKLLGRPVDPNTQIPIMDDDTHLERIVWVDFKFTTIGVSVLPFLRKCTEKVASTLEAIYRIMEIR